MPLPYYLKIQSLHGNRTFFKADCHASVRTGSQ